MTPTPPQHRESRITAAGRLMDQAAALGNLEHATEDSKPLFVKRRLFAQGWKIAEPQLRALARKALNGDRGDEDIDDVMSYTLQKTWRAVQTGYQPKNGYESILSGVPARAAHTIIARKQKHRDNPTISLDVNVREGESLGDLMPDTHDPQREAVQGIERSELRIRLDKGARRARLLGETVAARVLVYGLGDSPADTAKRLGVSKREVDDAVEWISEHRYALLQASDKRFGEYLLDETGGVQMELGEAS